MTVLSISGRSMLSAVLRATGVHLCTAVSIVFGVSFSAYASDAVFDDFPLVIFCETGGTHRAFYFSTVGEDGVATYISPDRQAGTITVTGKAVAVGGNWSGSCSGKTLDELRSASQAFDLAR